MRIRETIFRSTERFLKGPKSQIPRYLLFCGILLMAVLFRWTFGELHPGFRRDEIYYMDMANYFGVNGEYPPDYGQQPPLLVFALGCLAALGLNLDVAARNFTRIAGLLFVIPWWWIGKLLFLDRRGAWLLMGLAAIAPYPIFMSNQVLREALSLPIAAWFLLILLQYWKQPHWIYTLLGAILCALGSCCRYEFSECVLVFAVLIIYSGIRRKISLSIIFGHSILLLAAWGILFIVLLATMKLDVSSWISRWITMIGSRLC